MIIGDVFVITSFVEAGRSKIITSWFPDMVFAVLISFSWPPETEDVFKHGRFIGGPSHNTSGGSRIITSLLAGEGSDFTHFGRLDTLDLSAGGPDKKSRSDFPTCDAEGGGSNFMRLGGLNMRGLSAGDLDKKCRSDFPT